MPVQPYLFFEGRCDEALEFYRKAVDAEVGNVMRFKDSPAASPDCPTPPGDKVMHASFRVGGTEIFASDGQSGGKPEFKGFALAISTKTEADAGRFFAALSDGGKVLMPLTKTFFSPKFGMTADRFGVMWMIMVVS